MLIVLDLNQREQLVNMWQDTARSSWIATLENKQGLHGQRGMLWNIPSECQGRDSSKDVSLGAKKFPSTHDSLGLGVERYPRWTKTLGLSRRAGRVVVLRRMCKVAKQREAS